MSWGTDGGLLRGCANTGQFSVVPYSDDPNIPVPTATVVVDTYYPWSGTGQLTCTSSSPQFTCSAAGHNANGNASWAIWANY